MTRAFVALVWAWQSVCCASVDTRSNPSEAVLLGHTLPPFDFGSQHANAWAGGVYHFAADRIVLIPSSDNRVVEIDPAEGGKITASAAIPSYIDNGDLQWSGGVCHSDTIVVGIPYAATKVLSYQVLRGDSNYKAGSFHISRQITAVDFPTTSTSNRWSGGVKLYTVDDSTQEKVYQTYGVPCSANQALIVFGARGIYIKPSATIPSQYQSCLSTCSTTS
jgi:hypothetical protein